MPQRLAHACLFHKRLVQCVRGVLSIVSPTRFCFLLPRSRALTEINYRGFYLADAVPGSVGGNCLSDVSSGMVLTYGSTASGDSTSWSIATTTLTASSTVGAIGIQGWNIKYPTTATSTSITSTTTQSSSTTPITSTTASAASQNLSTSSSGSGSGLTTGAKTGIGVGVGVGAIGVIALLAALSLFRKRKQITETQPAQSLYSHYSQPPTMSVPQPQYQQYPAELNAIKLLPGEGGNPPAELPSRGWALRSGIS
jgi:hypothetical protein